MSLSSETKSLLWMITGVILGCIGLLLWAYAITMIVRGTPE